MNFIINKRIILWVLLLAACAVGIILGVVFTLKGKEDGQSGLRHGGVVSNGLECANIGAQFMRDGGSVVDVAVGTLICEGVMVPQSMGVGGGFVGLIYTKSTGKIETIIARESAPAAAHKDMFENMTSVTGALAGGVPGELKGYWEMHQKYGKLPWNVLFTPSIKLCLEGVYVSPHMSKALKQNEDRIRSEPSMAELFIKPDGSIYQEGEYFKCITFADTLQKIADNGVDIFYDGELGKMFIEDFQAMGGIITLDDLKNYRTRWSDKDHVEADIIGGYKLYTTPLPSSGIVLSFMLKVLNEIYTDVTTIFWQRIIETFKFAYGQRTNLGDAEYEPENRGKILETFNEMRDEEFIKLTRAKIHDDSTSQNFADYSGNFSSARDHGTANIAILGTDGSAVVITSTVNTYFGSKVRSTQTGIILNDEMDDFAVPKVVNAYNLPPSPANFIQPNKMPLSSMCPSIILDEDGNVKMLVGAAGGSRITTSVATAIVRYLVRNQDIDSAVNDPRLHHQLVPMEVSAEENVSSDVIEYLEKVGHVIALNQENSGFAAVTAIGARDPQLEVVFDKRRLGSKATVKPQNKMQH